jgi:peptide/nickel transport system substrate-binding protein
MSDVQEAGYWQGRTAGRVSRRGVLRAGVTSLAGGAALGLLGCSGSKRTAGTQRPGGTPATPATTPSAGSAATPAPRTSLPAGDFKTGGVIQSDLSRAAPDSDSLDPVAGNNSFFFLQLVSGFHYSRLFRFNSGPDPQTSLSREPVPDLVSSYEISADGLSFMMKLRQGVNFHPPLSRVLTAADVKASWDYFTTSTANANRGVYAPIVDSLTTPDAGTLVFSLKQPYAPFLNKLADPSYFWIMPQEATLAGSELAQRPAGSGPWIYSGQTPTAITWKKNPDYFLKGIPFADGVQLNIIGDTATLESQFQAGKLDLLHAIPAADVSVIQNTVPGASSVEYVQTGLNFLFFSNVQDPNSPFMDPRVRQAASLAIDRQVLVDSLYQGRGVWDNIVPPGLGRWSLDPRSKEHGESSKWFKQDIKGARQLLAAAGHLNTEFKFLYTNNAYGPAFNATADAIARMLPDAGFKVTPVTVDYLSVYINGGQGIFLKGAPPNTIVCALESPFIEADEYLTGMLTRGGNRNHDLLDDPALAALVQKQQVELDENKRLQIVYDIQRLHAEKMYYPPLIYAKSYSLCQRWVQNFFLADDWNFGTESYAYMSVNNR